MPEYLPYGRQWIDDEDVAAAVGERLGMTRALARALIELSSTDRV